MRSELFSNSERTNDILGICRYIFKLYINFAEIVHSLVLVSNFLFILETVVLFFPRYILCGEIDEISPSFVASFLFQNVAEVCYRQS